MESVTREKMKVVSACYIAGGTSRVTGKVVAGIDCLQNVLI